MLENDVRQVQDSKNYVKSNIPKLHSVATTLPNVASQVYYKVMRGRRQVKLL